MNKAFHVQKIVKFMQTPQKLSDPIKFDHFIKNEISRACIFQKILEIPELL